MWGRTQSTRAWLLFAGVLGIVTVVILVILAMSNAGQQTIDQPPTNQFQVGKLVYSNWSANSIIVFPGEGIWCPDAVFTWGPESHLWEVNPQGTGMGSAVFIVKELRTVSLDVTCGDTTIHRTLDLTNE